MLPSEIPSLFKTKPTTKKTKPVSRMGREYLERSSNQQYGEGTMYYPGISPGLPKKKNIKEYCYSVYHREPNPHKNKRSVCLFGVFII